MHESVESHTASTLRIVGMPHEHRCDQERLMVLRRRVFERLQQGSSHCTLQRWRQPAQFGSIGQSNVHIEGGRHQISIGSLHLEKIRVCVGSGVGVGWF